MLDWPSFIDPSDLAPGELIPHKNLPPDIELYRVEPADASLFELAYQLLEKEFNHANEIETREVLMERLGWRVDPADREDLLMDYELLVLKVAGKIAAVRDHSAIISQGEVTLHLSHVLVLPEWRRFGLATLLRTLPVTFARRTAASAGVPDAFVTLFCEMDPYDPTSTTHQARRISYEKAGFLSIPPGHGYMQPDFRATASIHSDPNGPHTVALDLLFRRIGREHETQINRTELIAHISRIYQMYGRNIAPEHMAACLAWLEKFREHSQDAYPLLPPTATR